MTSTFHFFICIMWCKWSLSPKCTLFQIHNRMSIPRCDLWVLPNRLPHDGNSDSHNYLIHKSNIVSFLSELQTEIYFRWTNTQKWYRHTSVRWHRQTSDWRVESVANRGHDNIGNWSFPNLRFSEMEKSMQWQLAKRPKAIRRSRLKCKQPASWIRSQL
jgi:hypothetical protein